VTTRSIWRFLGAPLGSFPNHHSNASIKFAKAVREAVITSNDFLTQNSNAHLSDTISLSVKPKCPVL